MIQHTYSIICTEVCNIRPPKKCEKHQGAGGQTSAGTWSSPRLIERCFIFLYIHIITYYIYCVYIYIYTIVYTLSIIYTMYLSVSISTSNTNVLFSISQITRTEPSHLCPSGGRHTAPTSSLVLSSPRCRPCQSHP